jgi:hypothetical protein
LAEFADLISNLPLYQELERAPNRDAIGRANVDRLKALVNEVADTAGPAMAEIPVTFRQYTVHDIRHCRNVIARMGDILPPETLKHLNALEITFLLLAALLHDVGMVVTEPEKKETLLSADFRRFRAVDSTGRNKAIEEAREAGNESSARAIEDALLAEYYRRLHSGRVRQFMDRHLASKIRYQDVDFTEDLARLCESHAWGVNESNDPRHPEKAVSRLDANTRIYNVRVNLQYLACILRLADILDFDRSRTPLVVFQHIDFSEERSREEWNKHLQVKGYEITPTQIAFDIPCSHSVFYVAVQEFLGWIDDELRQCRYLVEDKPQATAERYKLLLPQVSDRHKVRMSDPSYIAGAFRFQLAHENIFSFPRDKSIYPDPSLFLRELLQNALDACRRKEADMKMKRITYTPKIVVWDRTDDPDDRRVVFQDNGIGMSQRIIEHYFLRIGRSYYRSPEFDAELQRLQEAEQLDTCSQFGIGILSCFLVADRFEVETLEEGFEPIRMEIESPSKYIMMRRLAKPEPHFLYQEPTSDEENGPPKKPGTRLTVHFRKGVLVDVWQTLQTFAANVDYPITVYHGDNNSRTIQTCLWKEPLRVSDYLFSSLNDGGVSLPDLEKFLTASSIPFHKWEFSRHIRGCSWFWLLNGDNGDPTPKSGFLRVGSELRVEGPPALLMQLEQSWNNENRAGSFSEWSRIDLDYNWPDLTPSEKAQLNELIERRSNLLEKRYRLQHWAALPEAISSLLKGSLDWVDQPVELASKHKTYDVIKVATEDQLALHSILLPAGVVKWVPAKASSRQVWLRTLFGGLRLDVRGPQAPPPAAHRFYIDAEDAEAFRQQYLHAALLHGLDLVVRYGRTPDWRKWFCELASNAMEQNLSRLEFARLSGRLLEEACGLAVRVNEETLYLKRAEILELIPGPIYLLDSLQNPRQGILGQDAATKLLYDFEYSGNEPVELDISRFPIVKAKK